MTIRTEPYVKNEFTELCKQFGMSTNTAMNIFMRAVMETKTIPFTIKASAKTKETIKLQLTDEETEEYLKEINSKTDRIEVNIDEL